MRYRERRNDPEDFEKSLAESRYGLPSRVTVLEHRRKQQRAEKQNVIEAGPDVPDPRSKIFEKLAPERNGMAFELPGIVIGAENPCVSSAPLLEPKQAAVLRIQIEQELVFDGKNLRNGRAVGDKSQHRVGPVAAVVDQMPGDHNRTGDTVGGNRQPGECIGSNLLVLRFDFPPGDLAIAVGIEPNGVIEITQRDVPMSGQVVTLQRKREIAVARLVGEGGRNPKREQENQS